MKKKNNRWILFAAIASVVLLACTNDSSNGSKTVSPDSQAARPVAPMDNTRSGDTSSYERMPGKLNDSMP